MTCIRKAWLTLGDESLLLEDLENGYVCSSLDLGYPTPREVVNNNPDADGITDRTRYMGARVVSADITAIKGLGAVIDAVARSFAPYMVPSQRPVLHYILEEPSPAERTLVLRAADYTWKIEGDQTRAIHLQWVAASPVATGAVESEATAWAGTNPTLGRSYDLVFDRVYVVGGVIATTAMIESPGDLPVQPYLRVYGPIDTASVDFATSDGAHFNVTLDTRIDAGHFAGIDTVKHAAYMDDDPAQPLTRYLDWPTLTWPVLPVLPAHTLMTIQGNNTTSISQVVAAWRDRYL